MALLFMEGWDWAGDYSDLVYSQNFGANRYDGYFTIDTGYGGVGKCLRMDESSRAIFSVGTLTNPTVVIGAAFQIFSAFYTTSRMIRFMNSEGAQACIQCYTDGYIKVFRGDYNGTQVAVTDDPVVTLSTWHYLEVKMYFHNSAGYVIVKIDGDEVINETGLDLIYQTTETVEFIEFWSNYNAVAYWDDIYCCDDSGTKNNDWLGQCQVKTLSPSSAGNYSQFTPSGEASNYLCVDDIGGVDGDTTYVGSNVAGEIDTYDFDDLAITGGQVFAVGVQPCVRLDEGGQRTYKAMVRIGSTDYPCSGEKLAMLEYRSNMWYMEDSPAGGDWTEAGVNEAEFGVKLMT